MIDVDALASDPDMARDLPRETLTRVMIACALALMLDPAPSKTMARVMSDALTTADAARLIGISANTLSHRAHQSPYSTFLLPTGTRRLAFSRKAIEAWQQKDGQPKSPVRRNYPWLQKSR
jgi:hypothetical protein